MIIYKSININASNYKTGKHTKLSNIKKGVVNVSTSPRQRKTNTKSVEIKPLRKENVKFLEELGFSVNQN